MNKPIVGIIAAVVIIIAVVLIAMRFTGNGGNSETDVKEAVSGMIAVCVNPDCGATMPMDSIMGGGENDTVGTANMGIDPDIKKLGYTNMAFVCPKCKKHSVFMGAKCKKCGNTYALPSASKMPAPPASQDKCPECGEPAPKQQGK